MTDQVGSIPARRWRRLRYRSIILIMVMAIVFVARGPILRAMAIPLIFEDRPGSATSVLIINGDERYSAADQFQKENPGSKILLMKHSPDRLVRLKILPSPTDQARNELERRGVDKDRVTIIAPTDHDISASTAFGDWLKNHPDERLIVLCDAYYSRNLRWQLNRELPTECAARLFVRPLTNRSFDSSRWWSSKRGVMTFAHGWLTLVLPLVQSGHQTKAPQCDPEFFQPLTP